MQVFVCRVATVLIVATIALMIATTWLKNRR